MEIETIRVDYQSQRGAAESFLKEFLHQFSALVERADIKLGVPIEGRVKDWSSLAEKLDRKALNISSCKEISDLIGIRAIALFKRDVVKLCKLTEKTFKVSSFEDKQDTLEISQFGYISQHYNATLPNSWKKMPSFGSSDFNVEIQIRTLSQHIWAASSHVLQYKNEADVPRLVSRSIHRVAALLETVDLEFERVLDEREAYSKSANSTKDSTQINADNIAIILNKTLPIENRKDPEPYSLIVSELAELGLTTIGELKEFISKHFAEMMAEDQKRVAMLKGRENPLGTSKERIDRGVYFTHVGLLRGALKKKFGDDKVLEVILKHKKGKIGVGRKKADKKD